MKEVQTHGNQAVVTDYQSTEIAQPGESPFMLSCRRIRF
jgi:hypothetical protein